MAVDPTNRYLGKNQILKIDGTDVVPLKEVTITKEVSLVESTAGSETFRSHIPHIRQVSGSFKYVQEGTEGDQPHTALLIPDGTKRTFQYGPEGTLAGTHAADHGSVFIERHEVTASYEGLVEWTATFRSTGTWVKNVETDTW